jgi:hypothetical protein
MMRWILIFVLISSAAVGQQFVQGKVVDKETGKPVPFASIGIIGLPRGTSSNIDGEFSLNAPNPYSLRITCLGYESVTLNSADSILTIELKPIATQLEEIVILYKEINPRKIVRKAFASIPDNYNNKSFLQKFFYRQYSKTDIEYERLIEASVDIWKEAGYRKLRATAGEKEAMRINQLRRSMDIKGMVQGQTPIFLGNILQTDIASYQTSSPGEGLRVFDEVSNLKTDFARYSFTFNGITRYDGQEVYKINYQSATDSVLTTSGYVKSATARGTLFITTDTYAFVKTEDVREDGLNTIKSSSYYLKHKDKYYPYHLVREGESNHKNKHYFHVELMAVEISHDVKDKFTGRDLSRANLLSIPYDSSYWSSSTILKTTPLENTIIRSLGGGNSLNKQFYLYKQYELNVTNGGINGEEKFNWFKEDSRGKRILYVCFWDSNIRPYLRELELAKQLYKTYGNKVAFVFISTENDEARWQQLVYKYNLFSDGIINYRVGDASQLAKRFKVNKIPTFVLVAQDGNIFELNAKPPSDLKLEEDFKNLIDKIQ